jgi:hypothetical protein
VVHGAGLAPDGQIRAGVYLNSWIEASGATVTHLEDFENGKLFSNVTVAGKLHNFVGTIKEI